MNKKIYTTILITIILVSGCSLGSSEETKTVSNISTYESDSYAIEYPPDWEIIAREKMTSDIPSTVDIAFRNNVKNEIYTANTNITIHSIDRSISSKDFAIASTNKIKKDLTTYFEDSSSETQVSKTDKKINAFEVYFTGRKTANEPLIVFHQIYVVDYKTVYTITASYKQNEDESVVKNLDSMLKSFSLK